MNLFVKYFSFVISLVMTSCYDGVNETVETAFQWPIPPALKYKFTRDEESSVHVHECLLIRSSVDYIYERYMSRAYMGKGDYEEVIDIFQNGRNGFSLEDEIAVSMMYKNNKSKILHDFQQWFDTSARISGRGQSRPNIVRNSEATTGHTGYVGRNTGDKDLYFVDEKGFAPAEIFYYAVKGAIYLDKILNVNIHPSILNNQVLIDDNAKSRLVEGHNYTEFEHHWDLAYGYFDLLKDLTLSDGGNVLKGSKERIFNSFVRGREFLATPFHEQVILRADTIRTEIVRVFVTKTINLLTGVNTYTNIDDDVKSAFRLISQAYGMIYSLQFVTDREGNTMISYDETKKILNKLESGMGLWDREKLLGNEINEGTLKNIAVFLESRFDSYLK